MDNKNSLSELFTCRGCWWKPTSPETRIWGTLTHDPANGIKLELDGSFRTDPLNIGDDFGFLQCPVIYGETLEGKWCTLAHSHETNYHISSPGGARSSFTVQQLFIGHKHVDPVATEYASTLVVFDDLGEWVHRNPFKEERKCEQNGRTTTVLYEKPMPISAEISSLDAIFSIESCFYSNDESHTRVLRHEDQLRITPNVPQKAEWFLNVLYKFRVLLSLFVGQPVFLKRIRLCSDSEKLTERGDVPYKRYIDLCLRQVGGEKAKQLAFDEIPFTYSTVAQFWQSILNTWFEKKTRLESLVGLLFGVSINRSTPVEYQFLALIQAVESHHRAFGSDLYLEKAEYESIKRSLIDAIPQGVESDHRAALKSRITYGNEYSLRKRLDLSLKDIPLEIVAMITNDDRTFVSRIVDTRNYLTHRDETHKENVLDFKGMFNATVSLKLLAEFLLLREIGFPVELLTGVITTHRHYRNRPRIY